MKTSTITTFFNTLGITTEILDQNKGLIELPFLNGLVVAVSDDTEGQLKATDKFREVSSKNKTLVASCVPMDQSGGSTIVPGIGCRVPVMTVYSGRHEDIFGTNGHLITNHRLMVLMKEMEELNTKARAKTPYLSWLCASQWVFIVHATLTGPPGADCGGFTARRHLKPSQPSQSSKWAEEHATLC